MNVIICGAGEVGYNIARLLSDEKNEITIKDIDKKVVIFLIDINLMLLSN